MGTKPKWIACGPEVEVTDLDEMCAVWNREIDGIYYASDETTWADVESLKQWRERQRDARDSIIGEFA